MADGRHLVKSENGHITATVLLIGTKFGMVTQVGPPKGMGSLNFELLEIQNGDGRYFKN